MASRKQYWWHYIPFLLLLPILLSYFTDPWLGGILAAMVWWLVLALVVWAGIALVRSFKIGGIHQKLIVSLSVLYVLAAILLVTVRIPAYKCDPEKMVRHYEQHKDTLDELVTFTHSVLNEGEYLFLELDAGHVDRMSKVEIDEKDLQTITKLLKKNRCISIDTSFPDYCDIGYKLVALGRYSFRVFLAPMTEEQYQDALENPQLIPYNDRVALLYGGGAAGPDCFSKEEKETFLRKHCYPRAQ